MVGFASMRLVTNALMSMFPAWPDVDANASTNAPNNVLLFMRALLDVRAALATSREGHRSPRFSDKRTLGQGDCAFLRGELATTSRQGEKPRASQDQARQSRTRDGAGDAGDCGHHAHPGKDIKARPISSEKLQFRARTRSRHIKAECC